ncbi:hypothetical protein P7K49_000777 [Saguinus oedipus]|uniref:F-box domain-containing protein n=1 Tax=Saguinus oedipus TaxID=9490 RepID=A0ABQ9WDL1_SAGOE|nr:hypothetical protein P7K49_000777 [Saguinus oedipus]
MGASASRCRAARIPTLEPEPEGALDLSQMPPELLLVVLSHVPPPTLLGRFRQCAPAYLARPGGRPGPVAAILARDHSTTGRAAAAHPQLPVSGLQRQALPAGLLLSAETHGTQPYSQPLWPRRPPKVDGAAWLGRQTTVLGAPSQTCFMTSFRYREDGGICGGCKMACEGE